MAGSLAPVHKPLVSASATTKKSNLILLGGDGGAIVPGRHRKAKQLSRLLAEVQQEAGVTKLYQERGVYNFYLKAPGNKQVQSADAGSGQQPRDLAPADIASGSSSGGSRQGRP